MIIKTRIKPGSMENKIEKISDSEYKVWINEKPIDNKANIALEKFLKKHFKKNLRIKSGFNSRIKFVEIED